MNGTIASGSGYKWWDDAVSSVTDSLGNEIKALQTGANSVDAFTTTMLNLIDTEKALIPSPKNTYPNVGLAGYS